MLLGREHLASRDPGVKMRCEHYGVTRAWIDACAKAADKALAVERADGPVVNATGQQATVDRWDGVNLLLDRVVRAFAEGHKRDPAVPKLALVNLRGRGGSHGKHRKKTEPQKAPTPPSTPAGSRKRALSLPSARGDRVKDRPVTRLGVGEVHGHRVAGALLHALAEGGEAEPVAGAVVAGAAAAVDAALHRAVARGVAAHGVAALRGGDAPAVVHRDGYRNRRGSGAHARRTDALRRAPLCESIGVGEHVREPRRAEQHRREEEQRLHGDARKDTTAVYRRQRARAGDALPRWWESRDHLTLPPGRTLTTPGDGWGEPPCRRLAFRRVCLERWPV